MEQNQQKTNRILDSSVNPILYFQPDYLSIQQYSELKVIESANFSVCFSIEGAIAKSLPKSPFGGVRCTKTASGFSEFQNTMERTLSLSGVKEIQIIQPPDYYPGFISSDQLFSAGYVPLIRETNQYLDISGSFHAKIHQMERRKLKNKVQFTLRKSRAINEVYHFIAKCRKEKGLEINISEEKLTKLLSLFPERYEVFEARKDEQLAATVIMTAPADRIAYYFLPATNRTFKKLSPMVSLLDYIYTYYQDKNFTYLDLGISSIHGKLQQSLFDFKRRLGAKTAERILFSKVLSP